MFQDPTDPLRIPIELQLRPDGTADMRVALPPADLERWRLRTLELIEQQRHLPPTMSYALCDAMPDAAQAVVIRDPARVPPILIVLDAAAPDDLTCCLARAILRCDEREVQRLEGRRMLTLLPDRVVRLTVDGRHRWRRDTTEIYNVGRHSIPRLRELAENEAPIDMPGVGDVRMCVLPKTE